MIKGKRHVKSIIDTVDPLGYVDENFEKPKFSRSILQFVQKVNMNGLVIFYPID